MTGTVTPEDDLGWVLRDGDAYYLTPDGFVLVGTGERMEILAAQLNAESEG